MEIDNFFQENFKGFVNVFNKNLRPYRKKQLYNAIQDYSDLQTKKAISEKIGNIFKSVGGNNIKLEYMFYEKINQKIVEFIAATGKEPNQIIMNCDDFLEFKKYLENTINYGVIDVDAEMEYMGRKIIRTNNLKKGEIKVGIIL